MPNYGDGWNMVDPDELDPTPEEALRDFAKEVFCDRDG